MNRSHCKWCAGFGGQVREIPMTVRGMAIGAISSGSGEATNDRIGN